MPSFSSVISVKKVYIAYNVWINVKIVIIQNARFVRRKYYQYRIIINQVMNSTISVIFILWLRIFNYYKKLIRYPLNTRILMITCINMIYLKQKSIKTKNYQLPLKYGNNNHLNIIIANDAIVCENCLKHVLMGSIYYVFLVY